MADNIHCVIPTRDCSDHCCKNKLFDGGKFYTLLLLNLIVQIPLSKKRRKRRNSRLPTAILVERSQSSGEMFSSGSLKTRKRRGRKKGVVHQRWRRGGKWPCNTGRYRLAHRASARTPCPNFQDTKERRTHVDNREQPSFENIEFDEERERIAESVLLLLPLICHRHLARKVCHS